MDAQSSCSRRTRALPEGTAVESQVTVASASIPITKESPLLTDFVILLSVVPVLAVESAQMVPELAVGVVDSLPTAAAVQAECAVAEYPPAEAGIARSKAVFVVKDSGSMT